MEKTNPFTTVMAQKDDVELIRIVSAERNDYQPEAIAAAEEEIKRRNISVSMYQDFAGKIETLIEIEKSREEVKRQLPLQNWIKVIALLFPAFFFFIIGAGLTMFGYQKRGKDLCQWTLYGCALYTCMLFIIYNML